MPKSFILEVRVKFYWNLIMSENFRTSGRGEGTILVGGKGTQLHYQPYFDYRIINLNDFQEHLSNTYTRINNHN